MSAAFLADALLVAHGLFIVWVVLGGLVVWRRPVLAWLHLPAAVWGVWISWSGRICPLTPIEQRLRRAAGEAGYEGGFIDHYVGRLIYPEGLTPAWQFAFGAFVLAVNLVAYALAAHRVRSRRRPQETRA
jgi:hypothetical protein